MHYSLAYQIKHGHFHMRGKVREEEGPQRTFVPSLNAAGRTAFPGMNENTAPAASTPQTTKINAMPPFNYLEVWLVQMAPLGDMFMLTTWYMPVMSNTSAAPITAWVAAMKSSSSGTCVSRFALVVCDCVRLC